MTLFEYEDRSFSWTNPCDLAALERLNQAARAEILHPTAHGLRATQFVGVVRFGQHTIQVLPKMYRDEADTPERTKTATRNLLHLLAYAGQLPIHEHAIAPLLRRNADWFEILTRLFVAHLMEAWQHGPVRRYQLCEDDLPMLRGKWRLTEQLRRPERQHRFAVAYDEFTADNPLNRVFRFVVERLWRLTRDADNRRNLGELRQWLDEVRLFPSVTVADADSALLTRLHRQYEPLLNLARLFLDGGALQLTAGALDSFAFVFDMNLLFETFVVNFLRRHRHAILPDTLKNCDLLPQSLGATLHLARAQDKPTFRLKPDLVFRLGDAFPLLLDTKYKVLDPADRKLGIAESDFYQMLAYAHRYRCPRVLLLYPQTAGMPAPLHKRFHLEHAPDTTIEAATLDLRIDLGKQEERQKFVGNFRRLLEEGAFPA